MPNEQPQEEPRPTTFRVIPHHSPVTGNLTGFTVEDPEGGLVTKRNMIVTEIHKRFPGISFEELENARISYSRYRAVVTLGRVSFAGDSLTGKPPVRILTTDERLMKYGVPPELHETVIQMDRDYSLAELKDMCRDRGLPISGEKKKLAAAIVLYDMKKGGDQSEYREV